MAKVLITDDASFMRMMLKDLIIKAGHDVIGEAVNGKDAVAKVKQLQPDIVTMDITMPDMDGIQAVKLIKKDCPQVKIIMCSAMGQKAMVVEAIQSGATDFIVKPFQADHVKQCIQKAASS